LQHFTLSPTLIPRFTLHLVVLAKRVADAAERLDGRQVPEGEPADYTDQRQERTAPPG
jgi:hypothetical protein